MRAGYEQVLSPPNVSWAFREFRQDAFAFSWHLHAEVELTLITRGTGTRIIGTSIESYRPGDLALIGPEVPHAYVSTPGTHHHEAIVAQFRSDFLGADFFARPEFLPIAKMLDAARGAVLFVPDRGVREQLTGLGALPPPERTLGLVRLLGELARDQRARSLTADGMLARLGQPARRRVDAICAYLHQSYARPFRLAAAASVVHMSPPAVSRFFRRAVGRTLTDYVAELRIAAACQLLTDSDLPIGEIALRSGYENVSNFNRRFRALRHMTPREYRRVMTTPALTMPTR